MTDRQTEIQIVHRLAGKIADAIESFCKYDVPTDRLTGDLIISALTLHIAFVATEKFSKREALVYVPAKVGIAITELLESTPDNLFKSGKSEGWQDRPGIFNP